MCEEDYKNAFQTIEMKSEMKERIINRCSNEPHNKLINKGSRTLLAAAFCIMLFLGMNAVTTYAYGINLLSKFYTLIQTEDKKVVEINMTDRREDAAYLTANASPDSTNKDLYSFLNECDMTNLIVPQNLSNDWKLVDSSYKQAGLSTDSKSSIYFNMSNGTDQIDASINAGIADTSAYQVGIDYVETKKVNEIELLIVHLKKDLTYEMYLKELELQLLSIMKISAEEFYKTDTYAELGSEEAYQNFIKYGTFIDFSAGGYDYSYALTKGINTDDFLNSLY